MLLSQQRPPVAQVWLHYMPPPLDLTSHPARPKPKKVTLEDILAWETPVHNTDGTSAGDAAEALGHAEAPGSAEALGHADAMHHVNAETTEAQQHVANTLFPPEEMQTAPHDTSVAKTIEALPAPPALSPVVQPALPPVTPPPGLPANVPQHPAVAPVTPSLVSPAALS